MLQLRILSPAGLTADILQVLESEPCVSGLTVVEGAAIRPVGDVVSADLPREGLRPTRAGAGLDHPRRRDRPAAGDGVHLQP
jgi:hypothetical protein